MVPKVGTSKYNLLGPDAEAVLDSVSIFNSLCSTSHYFGEYKAERGGDAPVVFLKVQCRGTTGERSY